MPETISKETAKLLKDVTGEPRIDAAIRMTVEDALHHRLERIEAEIADFEERYDMTFEAFAAAWEEGEIQDEHSYDVESDYWSWETLVTRRETIEDALGRL